MDYDQSHTVPIECTVVSADGGKSRGGPRGGAGGYAVSISTKECGDFRMSWQVTEDTADDIAAELEPGNIYTFQIGENQNKILNLTQKLGIGSAVYSFEKKK
ncbi:hypothetical protein ACIPVK_09510 [Paeniglutamicibacter sp. MACA_103]|uniref:hypothetical protein n=1 Tax=Paeniglutamicibacter sp. MACA_103 TaxID=3377337 RepID=UPI00389570AB